MYKNFEPTPDNGYLLKKKGMVSVVIFGGVMFALAILGLIAYLNDTRYRSGLLLGAIMVGLVSSLLIFWVSTGQFIIYPKQRTFKYSTARGLAFKEFRFEELERFVHETTRYLFIITTGNCLKLRFKRNGKYPELVLGNDISAKKMRSICEEINQIMSGN